MVSHWAYLGVVFQASGSYTIQTTNARVKANNKFAVIHSLFASKHINSLPLQLRLFESLAFSVILYAAHIWSWDSICELEKVQNQFIKRIFRLDFSTPPYLLHREFAHSPYKFHLFRWTFKWWIRARTLNDKDHLHSWWNHWLSYPPDKYNPYSKFILKLKIPPDLTHFSLIHLSPEQINRVMSCTLDFLNKDHKLSIHKAISSSKFHYQYKFISKSLTDCPQPYLTESFPYILNPLYVNSEYIQILYG